MKLCAQCATPMSYPYFCRPCWVALGAAGQRAFYVNYCAGNRELSAGYEKALKGRVS